MQQWNTKLHSWKSYHCEGCPYALWNLRAILFLIWRNFPQSILEQSADWNCQKTKGLVKTTQSLKTRQISKGFINENLIFV